MYVHTRVYVYNYLLGRPACVLLKIMKKNKSSIQNSIFFV